MDYELIKQEMQYEIDNPQRGYLPNCPGAFIRDRLFKKMDWEAAIWFWDGYCRGGFSIPDLDLKLHEVKALAANEHMPDWGTRGT